MNHVFFELYCMMYNRYKIDLIVENTNNLMSLGYRSIYFVLKYLQYQNIFMIVMKYNALSVKTTIYEDIIEVDCAAITGIRMRLKNDPVNCLTHLCRTNKLCIKNIYPNVYAQNGHLECLKYSHENGIRIKESIAYIASIHGNLDCIKYVHKYIRIHFKYVGMMAATHGYLDCLKYAIDNNCPDLVDLSYAASESGHVECLKYLYDVGCRFNARTFEEAACNGSLECLKFLHAVRCPFYKHACMAVAMVGSLECLKFLHENGHVWDEDICIMALCFSQENLKIYACANKLEYHSDEVLNAVRKNKFACYDYAVANGCPKPEQFTEEQYKEGYDIECCKFIVSKK